MQLGGTGRKSSTNVSPEEQETTSNTERSLDFNQHNGEVRFSSLLRSISQVKRSEMSVQVLFDV